MDAWTHFHRLIDDQTPFAFVWPFSKSSSSKLWAAGFSLFLHRTSTVRRWAFAYHIWRRRNLKPGVWSSVHFGEDDSNLLPGTPWRKHLNMIVALWRVLSDYISPVTFGHSCFWAREDHSQHELFRGSVSIHLYSICSILIFLSSLPFSAYRMRFGFRWRLWVSYSLLRSILVIVYFGILPTLIS